MIKYRSQLLLKCKKLLFVKYSRQLQVSYNHSHSIVPVGFGVRS